MNDECTYDEAPNVTTLFANITPKQIAVFTVGSSFLIFTWAVFITESVLFYKKASRTNNFKSHILFIQATYVVYASMSYIALLSPRSAILTELSFEVYFAFALKEFLCLLINLIKMEQGGILESNSKVSLAAPPLLCLFPCILPKVSANQKFYKWVKLGVYQTVFLRPISSFIRGIMWTNGIHIEEIESNGAIGIQVLSIVSVLIAMYAITLVNRASLDFLSPYRLRVKFACIQTVMCISTIQSLILTSLAKHNIIPCEDPFNSVVRASSLHYTIVLPEMTLLIIISYLAYRKSYLVPVHPDNETTPLLTNGMESDIK